MEDLSAIILVFHLFVVLGSSAADVPQLKRHKRDWVIPTKKLRENIDYSDKGFIARIRSDLDEGKTLYYSLLGPGANEVPMNLFVVGETNGLVYVTRKLDREEQESYTLSGVAKFSNGTVAESGIGLKFVVDDDNDNAPVFDRVPPAAVNESSPAGTLVGIITATDEDKSNTSNSKIAYSLVKQVPSDGKDLFRIDRHTGAIYVKEAILDRETQDSYILTVNGCDLDGAPGGLTGTGSIQVNVVDINDNRPRLEKDEYAGNIKENTAKVEVMRFKVLDDDKEETANWEAVFDIVSGNEEGIFSIKTDPQTNEGILMLEKPVDFEKNPDIKLGVIVSNVAPFEGDGGGDGDGSGDGQGEGDGGGEGGGDGGGTDDGLVGGGGGGGGGGGAGAGAGAGGGAGGAGGGGGGGTGAAGGPGAGGSGKKPVKRPKKGKVYPVNIAVLNEREGAAFNPPVKPVPISENPEENPLMEVITVFTATDSDSGLPAENVRYAKVYDPDNWLLLDPETAEIRLQKVPDRESPFLVNGTYYAEIVSLSQDTPFKIVTGTIALQVGDMNDNCPSLTRNVEYTCSDSEVIDVTAVDVDGDPNSAPFSFHLEEESQEEWRVVPLNDTSVSLMGLRPLWPGRYQIAFTIRDQQGLACPDPQHLELHVCSCEGGESCREDKGALAKESSSTFGGLGVGALILGLLMLLSVSFLLLTCSCERVFSEIPLDGRQQLIVYHTEGRGEDKAVPLLSSVVPITSTATTAYNVASNTKAITTTSFGTHNTAITNNTYNSGCGAESRIQQKSFRESRERQVYSVEEKPLSEIMSDITLPDVFLHQYYSQKASCIAEKQSARDCVLEYDFEGQASSACSVDCCSILESNTSLQFLDDLGPKFKTLAEICGPPRPPTPLTCQSIVSPVKDEVDHVVSMLETKPTGIHVENVECNQSLSQSSTRFMRVNGAASGSMHEHSSQSTSITAQSPPITKAMLPSPAQMVLLQQQQQQPVYYTTTTVMQPMHYIVQPQPQSTMLLAKSPVTNLQDMVLLNGNSGYTEHILHGGTMAAGTGTHGGERVNIVSVVSGGVVEGLSQRVDEGHSMSCGGILSGHISGGATVGEGKNLVFKQRGSKKRTRSTTSTGTGFMST